MMWGCENGLQPCARDDDVGGGVVVAGGNGVADTTERIGLAGSDLLR